MAPSSDSLFSQKTSKEPKPKDSLSPRFRLSWLLPIGLLVGFAITAWFLFGDRLLPARTVQLGSVAAISSGTTEQASPTETSADPWEAIVIFQASGWIEPAPYPIRATALINGVIEEVMVLEGETVEKDDLLATLIDEDARLALSQAEAQLGQAKTSLQITKARSRAAQSTVIARQAQIESARARLAELKDDADRLAKIGKDATSAGEIRRAALRVDAQEAVLSVREAELEEWKSEASALELSVDQAARNQEEAESVVDEKALALDRTKICSPINGIIQRLLAAPGQKKMLGMDNPESATVAILYQPDSLQARIDVPLEQAAGLFPGQPVWIRTNLLPDKQFRGKVDRIVGEADLQRNTLQAKVLLLDSDPRLRPEMLCRAEFLASSQGETNSVSSSTGGKKLLLFIPTAALTKRSGDEATVWVVDPLNPIIKSQVVRLGVEQRDGEQQITDGLRPGQKVVINPASDLQEGDRIVAKTTAQNEEPQ